MKIGVISDTHGLLRPEAIKALKGVAHILHAGDVGNPEILVSLQQIAPVTAIRGNIDKGEWAHNLPHTEALQLRDYWIYMLHDRNALDLDPVAAGFDVIISGHSHRPLIEEKDDILYLNPGSAGRRRFSLPITLAYLFLSASGISTELVELL